MSGKTLFQLRALPTQAIRFLHRLQCAVSFNAGLDLSAMRRDALRLSRVLIHRGKPPQETSFREMDGEYVVLRPSFYLAVYYHQLI
jgi:uncharacterized protein YbjT (DUF2867 family)